VEEEIFWVGMGSEQGHGDSRVLMEDDDMVSWLAPNSHAPCPVKRNMGGRWLCQAKTSNKSDKLTTINRSTAILTLWLVRVHINQWFTNQIRLKKKSFPLEKKLRLKF
jgi:hypothetical protein